MCMYTQNVFLGKTKHLAGLYHLVCWCFSCSHQDLFRCYGIDWKSRIIAVTEDFVVLDKPAGTTVCIIIQTFFIVFFAFNIFHLTLLNFYFFIFNYDSVANFVR